MLLIDLAFYIISFAFVWISSGWIVFSVSKLARRLRMSSFAISFFILGLLTSIPELAVGINSIANGTPEIFVGNLLGGIILIFLFVIPLLATIGGGIILKYKLDKKNLIVALILMAVPSVMITDKNITFYESITIIILYFLTIYYVQSNNGIFHNIKNKIPHNKSFATQDILKIIAGIFVIFVSSNFIVDRTVLFGDMLSISPFYIGLIVLSLGTNIPELSIVIRSLRDNKKDIAFGNYVGSAAANAFLFGFLTLLNKKEIVTANNFFITFIFTLLALGLFYYFSKSKNNISRKEGVILLVLYFLFVILELVFAKLL